MRYILVLISVIIGLTTIQAQVVHRAGTEKIREILKNPEDKLFVVNFWATWCGPCVKEIPYFQKVADEYSENKVEFILMSLDFPSEVNKRLIPFIKKHDINLTVFHIDELDYDMWMHLVDRSWQGNLPTTLFYNNARASRHLVTKPLDESEIRGIIDSLL